MDRFEILISLTQVLLVIYIIFAKTYIDSYLRKKGEQRASKEDQVELTDPVEKIKNKYSEKLETHKKSLERGGIIFDKKLTSLEDLQKIFYKKLMLRRRSDDETSDEFYEVLSLSFLEIREDLINYLIYHRTVLDNDLRPLLEKCLTLCELGQIEHEKIGDEVRLGNFDFQISQYGLKCAEDLYQNIKEVIDKMTKRLDETLKEDNF